MRYYAVFDTNVLVSSLLTQKRNSATALVIDAVTDGVITPFYSPEMMEEYEEVLQRDKFPFSRTSIRRVLDMMRQFGVMVSSGASLPEEEDMPDKSDIIFYRVVMDKRDCDAYLITGNARHFPEKPFIVTPAEMMRIIRRSDTENPANGA